MKRHWRIVDRHIPRGRNAKGEIVTRHLLLVPPNPAAPNGAAVPIERAASPITFHSRVGRVTRIYRDEGRGVRCLGTMRPGGPA